MRRETVNQSLHLLAACRKGFPKVQQVNRELMDALKASNGEAVPLCRGTLCITLDVIGWAWRVPLCV